jgi:hypothetical protein
MLRETAKSHPQVFCVLLGKIRSRLIPPMLIPKRFLTAVFWRRRHW